MTISYNLDVSSIKWTYVFKILWRWKASLWKSVYRDLITWTILYYIVMFVYRSLLDESQQRSFEAFAEFCDKRLDYFPLMLMLGFFVATVVDRWKNIFGNIGFVDTVALYVSTYVIGNDEETRMQKRNLVRYVCLTQVLVLRDISVRVRKRFPNLEAVVEAGFLLPHERYQLDNIKSTHPKYWVPIQWAYFLVNELKKQGKVETDGMIINEINNFRSHLHTLCCYDYVPVPLAYPQTVALAIRFYFLISVVSRQYLIHPTPLNPHQVDFVIPFMTMFQFIFYVGWLKVAEALLNPLGEDDDDFESNYIIDRNISIALSIVDDADNELPKQMPDTFNTKKKPLYTEKAAKDPINPLIGSAALEAQKKDIDEDSKDVKMVPHPQYEAVKKTMGKIYTTVSSLRLRKKKSNTQPLITRKWHGKNYAVDRSTSLQECHIDETGDIEFGPPCSKIGSPKSLQKPSTKVEFNVPNLEEAKSQVEGNKELYLTSIKEENEEETKIVP